MTRLAPDLITRTPGVCGGRACIAGTRVPVWCVWRASQWTSELRTYFNRTLTAEQVAAAIAYATENKAEILNDIAENEA